MSKDCANFDLSSELGYTTLDPVRTSHKAAHNMVIEMDILDRIEACEDAFVPTDRQIAFKIKLLKSVSPAVLSKLDVHSLHMIKPHIAPFSIERVQEWIEDNPTFLEWCLIPDIHEVKTYKAREAAIDTIVEILGLRENDDKTLSLRLKAAELILKTEKVTNKTVNKLSVQGIPKELQNKSREALEQELTRLKE